MQVIPIAILGCGTVGSGVVRLLTEDADFIAERTGLRFEIRYVLAKEANPAAKAALDAAGATWVKSLDPILADEEVDIVVELIGGDTFALDCSQKTLEAGKALVTANKAMLAKHGQTLFPLAHEKGSCIAFEASCAGGVPLMVSLRDGLVANRVRALYGILNGTANYILSEMTAAGKSYDTALAEAQVAGFAEADPTFDVDGIDAAHKIAILAGLAFGVDIEFDAIPVAGIRDFDVADITYARELGYRVKLIASAEQVGDDGVSLQVHPALVAADNPLAMVEGPFNAVSIFGHAVGHVLLYGRGAGQSPTASAVVADLVDVANGHARRRFETLRIWPGKTRPANVVEPDELTSRFYVRLTVHDQPGVMAQVTRAFGDNGISLSGVLQKEAGGNGPVPIVVTTHDANVGAMRESIAAINDLDAIAAPAVWLRVLDLPEEGLSTTDKWHQKA